jgi:hypothetical protein
MNGNTIVLNGIKTTGACPECGDLDCETSHGSGPDGRKMHWTVCPTCGTHMVYVRWDCPNCPPNPVKRNEAPADTLPATAPTERVFPITPEQIANIEKRLGRIEEALRDRGIPLFDIDFVG